MKVLIVGAGIAGPAFAYWLNHHGLIPTIMEKAPRLRTGAYVVDFWGAGFDIADRMGLLPEIIRPTYNPHRSYSSKGAIIGGIAGGAAAVGASQALRAETSAPARQRRQEDSRSSTRAEKRAAHRPLSATNSSQFNPNVKSKDKARSRATRCISIQFK